jgi:NAD(P)-dependent dehydrogenase (short-subunit alcohol dehydrogenase family)
MLQIRRGSAVKAHAALTRSTTNGIFMRKATLESPNAIMRKDNGGTGSVHPMTEEARPGRLAGRIALVTGASRGIGRAVALSFAREGADLILVGRTQGALEEVDDEVRRLGRSASLVPADLADFAVIDRIAAAVAGRWQRLDILAGVAADLGTLSPLGHISPATWDRVIAVTLTANWRLIRAFDAMLRASDAGRAIFVTSSVAAGRAYWGAYATAKAGLDTMVRIYAHEVGRTTRVRANLIDPGATRTRMRAQAFPGEDALTVKPADDAALMEAFVSLAEPACSRNGETLVIRSSPEHPAGAQSGLRMR